MNTYQTSSLNPLAGQENLIPENTEGFWGE